MMKRLVFAALILAGLASPVLAQGCGPSNPSCIVPTAPPGTNNHQAASTAFVHTAVSPLSPGSPSGSLQYNNSGALGGVAGASTDGTAVTFSDGDLKLSGSSSGTSVLKAPATGGGTATLFSGSDTILGAASTATLTNKTYDTAGAGNSFSINGVAATANTGTGSVVRATSPSLTTPSLGVATATSINKTAITAPATGSTLAVADGKTATISNTLTFTGTDSSSVAFGTGGTVTYTIASGTSALGTSAISSATCATAVTTSATGTATTDVIDVSFNGDPTGVVGYQPLTSGMLTIIAYPTANNVNFKVCNNTSGSITPGAITLNWKVRR